VKFWPYRILKRDDDGVRADIDSIMQHFAAKGRVFDQIVFVPYAGKYLSELFIDKFGNSFDVNFVTVRRASTVSGDNFFRRFVFKIKWLSDLMRHVEVLIRLVKLKLGIKQKMEAKLEIGCNVAGKEVLVIDDSVDTGTTLSMVKSALLKKCAKSVTTACISNHLLPDKIDVDYSVYRYKLLRTKNSRDYYAT
jgi:phosphoribosylpyrophosphate synthetase